MSLVPDPQICIHRNILWEKIPVCYKKVRIYKGENLNYDYQRVKSIIIDFYCRLIQSTHKKVDF